MDQLDIRNEIIRLWHQVERPGIDKLIDFLVSSDFFVAPCSTQFHLAKPGGLAIHSFNVYNALVNKVGMYQNTFDLEKMYQINSDSLIVCALGKVNYYGTENKWRKDANGRWESYEAYCVKEKLPLGHGEKSVSVLQDFIQLEDYEKLAIRWHMGFFDAGIHFNYPSGYAFKAALEAHPLVTLLCTSDFEASQIIESGK